MKGEKNLNDSFGVLDIRNFGQVWAGLLNSS